MSNEVENILKQIKGSASSLEIFADMATREDNTADHKREMLEGVLMMLGGLEELHTDLKQAMEVQP
ncbi:hypothetical protein J9253_00535 [Thiothrix litoralis]|jgi:hypothetical protein|uniref:Uncharacterized protein n=1 Tax=Thiothrix litoralis TaxID=2891210 RepID=A0ABX7WTE7_9GAMM|nr:hypothetical protein [Thiothrix litoralis]QTR46486.1 hypothetical protein J9253_00535 [Thiothrix litoralis]